MSKVLYRKLRPQKFSELVGQEHIVTTLQNQIKNATLAHAYLFTGPRGVGKTTVARILARAANCLTPEGHEPDNKCAICSEILENKSLDFTEIDAASHTGVDNIREIIDHLPIPPTRSKYRTYIIDEVHMLSRGAFNALLKTLEEPPAHTLFILATTEIHKVPTTVISRTQRFDFKKLNDVEIENYLSSIVKNEKIKLDPEIISSISQSVDGGLRDALVLLEKATSLFENTENNPDTVQRLLGITPVRFRKEFLEYIESGNLSEAARFLKHLSTDGYNFEQFSRDFLEYLRNRIAESMSSKLAIIARHFLQAHQQLRFSPVPELPMMVAAIKSVEELNQGRESQKNAGSTDPKAETKTKEETQYVKIPAVGVSSTVSINPPYMESSGVGHIEFNVLQSRWMEVLTRVREYNQSLLTALKLAEPAASLNDTVTISFPYKFHADTVNAAKNRLVIERVLEELFGHKVKISCIAKRETNGHAVEEKPVVKGSNNDLLKSALDVLGGEVIN